MSAYISTLRVDLSRVRANGFSVDVTPPHIPPTLRQWGRRKDLPNVTAAVAAYESSDKAWGRLSRIALEYQTTPGSILGRINRRQLRR